MLKYKYILVFFIFTLPDLVWGFDANSAFKNGNSFYEKEQYNEAKKEYLNCLMHTQCTCISGKQLV